MNKETFQAFIEAHQQEITQIRNAACALHQNVGQTYDHTYYKKIYGVMEYLKTYVPYRQARMDQAGTALFFDGSSDNSLLIAGVASLGLLSVVGVAYFINQKKKRA